MFPSANEEFLYEETPIYAAELVDSEFGSGAMVGVPTGCFTGGSCSPTGEAGDWGFGNNGT